MITDLYAENCNASPYFRVSSTGNPRGYRWFVGYDSDVDEIIVSYADNYALDSYVKDSLAVELSLSELSLTSLLY